MANTKSAEKRIRGNHRKAAHNRQYKSRMRTLLKRAEQTILSGEPDEAAVRAALSTLDKAATKGVIHRNNAARNKSRLMKKYNQAREQSA